MASRVMHWLIFPAALGIALATALTITSLAARADDARVAQAVLSSLRAEFNELSAHEWEARATGKVEHHPAGHARVAGELDNLARADLGAGTEVRLRELVEVYESAGEDVLGLIARGDRERAEEVDERRLDPAYDRLIAELALVDRKEGVEAAKTLRRTKAGIFVSLGGALIALLALFWRFRRTEQRRAAEQTRTLEHEATHDHLTGLANRRRLMADLDGLDGRRLFVFFDLDGFKSYNDTFGHVEGDLLLQRLGRKLARAVGPDGVAYRLGGDELSAIAPPDTSDADSLVARCVEALHEIGEGFRVEASCGRVLMPDEAANGSTALLLADQRMYADKGAGRISARQQTRDVVLRLLADRRPELREHVTEVALLACATGELLGLSDIEVRELERAAELHDIGKIAIPDAILDKPGLLDEDEWRFMRRHTLIGEGMLSSAPALVSVAKVVRSSHERFDGKGYPDGLAGHAIPLASRIVFVCDAFHAMTSDRPYGDAMSVDEALAELDRGAGTQFDREVVIAFRAARAAPPAALLVA